MASRLQTAVVAGLAYLTATGRARAEDNVGIAVDLVAQVSAWVMSHASGILASAYDKAPIVVTILAALLILPVTALAALLIQWLRLRAKLNAAPAPARPLVARLHADTGEVLVLPAERAAVRLGRHDDNDICLPYATVHRHHAVIHRASETAFSITDVSGIAGNGISVNGTRVREAHLSPGDVIALGDASLTFDVASHSS